MRRQLIEACHELTDAEQPVLALVAHATSDEAPAFEDNVIDQAEYEQAVSRTLQCLREGAPYVTIRGPEWDGWKLTFSFGGQLPRETVQQANTVYLDCHQRYQREIDVAWSDQHYRILTASESAEANAEMTACLAGKGIALRPGAGASEWMPYATSAPIAFGPCADEVIAKWGRLPS